MVSCEKSLKSLHTFNLDIQAEKIIYASDNAALINAWQQCQQEARPFLLIGGGSNLLFLEDFSGTVVVNQIKGIRIYEVSDHWLIHAGSGENWHQFVQYTLERNIPGLENLALIPGMVGSSPIQNIGAYGVEIRDVCVYVDVLELNSGEITRIPAEACQFGYRESIFKHHYQRGYAIIGVGFRLSKTWKPVLNYGNLRSLDHKKVTPRDIFDSVCAMRRSKLPDPAEFGNAGSFFKNPVISADQARLLHHSYPDIPHYPQADKTVKIAAGWLIEQCQLKGRQSGGAAVYQQQALVLINQHQATSADVLSLASLVRASVGEKFGIWLEPEVRFIGHSGEVNALEVIS